MSLRLYFLGYTFSVTQVIVCVHSKNKAPSSTSTIPPKNNVLDIAEENSSKFEDLSIKAIQNISQMKKNLKSNVRIISEQ
jgi:glycosylphosphatidylinositol transamidase (GPIT) subunit GPI8